MNMDLSRKRIIMIHGLASKPPSQDLHELWTQCLIENIRVDDKDLAAALNKQPNVLRSAYWADATPHHLPDDAEYVQGLRKQVVKVVNERKAIKGSFHVDNREKIDDFFKDRGIDLVKVLAGALTVKDDVMKAFLRETELYDEDQYIADRMRKPLEAELRDAWDNKCDVAVISHSMGTFIAYDVLWQFSHRNVPRFKEYRRKRVQLFVTMGSPLGEPTVRDLLFARHHANSGKRQYPTNIDFWHNYSCLGDVVSHQEDLGDIFFKPMKKLGVLRKRPHRGIDYTGLHNPFVVVEHDGNKERPKRNPHKSYGYLVQPRLGTWLRDFLKGDLTY